jgi:hypothetical protein
MLMLLGDQQLRQWAGQCDVAPVVHELGALALEAVLIVVEVHEMALLEHGLVLEVVLHLEGHLAATPEQTTVRDCLVRLTLQSPTTV